MITLSLARAKVFRVCVWMASSCYIILSFADASWSYLFFTVGEFRTLQSTWFCLSLVLSSPTGGGYFALNGVFLDT